MFQVGLRGNDQGRDDRSAPLNVGVRSVAVKTMMAGSLLLSTAEAQSTDHGTSNDSTVLWLGGALLMAVGAFYVANW